VIAAWPSPVAMNVAWAPPSLLVETLVRASTAGSDVWGSVHTSLFESRTSTPWLPRRTV